VSPPLYRQRPSSNYRSGTNPNGLGAEQVERHPPLDNHHVDDDTYVRGETRRHCAAQRGGQLVEHPGDLKQVIAVDPSRRSPARRYGLDAPHAETGAGKHLQPSSNPNSGCRSR